MQLKELNNDRELENDELTDQMKTLESHLKVLEAQNKKLEDELRAILDDDEKVIAKIRDRSPDTTARAQIMESAR